MVRKILLSMTGMLAICLLFVACTPIGPATISRDRFDYTTAVADSWKRQMLLNIVRMRYGDAPIFLDLASIINQYEVQAELNASLNWSYPPSGNSQSAGAGGHYIDRPTITYSPMAGEKFARNLMTHIAPATVMSLVEGGYPIDMVFRLMLHSVNGVYNQFGGSARARRADPEFYPLLEKLRHIQASGAIALRVKKEKDREAMVILFQKRLDKAVEAEGRGMRRTLGLKEEGGEFRVVYGSVSSGEDEIAMLTRSILEILTDIASSIEVPEIHVAEHRVLPSLEPQGEGIKGPMVRVHCSQEKLGDDFVVVPYRDRWFWIDDRDFRSKVLFSFLMFVMTLTETGGKEGAPIVTINAGR